ncbi:MAG: hypothetical protein JST67_01190 [Bacteroidetes bacterium]|nr:hypothetical protein [Bacteroidota bacterium]
MRNIILYALLLFVSPIITLGQVIAGGGNMGEQESSVFICNDSTVRACGYNYDGELGDGSTTNSSVPVIVAELTKIIKVVGGYNFFLALKNDGTVWAWGNNGSGQLGDSSTVSTYSNNPVQVKGLSGVIAIAASAYSSLALKHDGTVWAWGDNSYGQLGNNTAIQSLIPIPVHGYNNTGFLTNIKEIACGSGHCLAVKNDGTVWTWGNNSDGQLGNLSVSNELTPVQVIGLTDVSSAVGGALHSLALKNDSTVWGWGLNQDGEIGDSTTIAYRYAPVQVHGCGTTKHLTGIIALAPGLGFHSLALKSNGTILGWGRNNLGQLTTGTSPSIIPISIIGLSGIIQISGGSSFSLVLKNDGTVWAFGGNQYGQLGNGTSGSGNSTPTQVVSLCQVTLDIKKIAIPKIEIKVLPNPITGIGRIVFDSPQIDTPHWVEIYTYSGVLVKKTLCTKNYYTIENTDFNTGFYLFKIFETNNTLIGSGKFIIQ